MYLIYNDYYLFNNNNSKCYLEIYSPLRREDNKWIDQHLSEYNYWLIIASENYLDTGLSLPGDVKPFLYNLFYKYDIPYNKIVYIELHNKEQFDFEKQVNNVVILDNKFPVSEVIYRPIKQNEIEYLKTGQPIRGNQFLDKSEGWELLADTWKEYVIDNRIV